MTSNWFPVNAKLRQPYAKTGRKTNWDDFKNALNLVPGTGTRNVKFKEAVNAAATPGVQIGTKSAYGIVHRVANGFVIKKMIFADVEVDYLKIFLNELRVGSSPGIERVGPKIYAWRVNRNRLGRITSGEYVMDDFTAGLGQHEKVIPLSTYMKKFRGGTCPMKGDPIFQKLKSTMTTFWRVTKGYHGDLHTNNLAVIRDLIKNKPVKIVVFDYGAHRPFKNPPPDNACFKDYIKLINKEFREVFQKLKEPKRKLGNTLQQTVYPGRNQPFRSNAMMLNAIKSRSSGQSRTPSMLKFISSRTHVSQSVKRKRWYLKSASTTRSPQPAAAAKRRRTSTTRSPQPAAAKRRRTSPQPARSKTINLVSSASHVSETPRSKSHVSETPQRRSASTTR